MKLPECSPGVSVSKEKGGREQLEPKLGSFIKAGGDYSNQNLNERAKECTSLAFIDFGLPQLLKTTYLTEQHRSVL